jgi:platelet-activating factor acetylhydrolase
MWVPTKLAISIDIQTSECSRFFLPAIHGRFPVGVTTFVTPVRPSQAIGSVKLRIPQSTRQEQNGHALLLEEVAFTAYYPAEIDASSKKGVPWFIR